VNCLMEQNGALPLRKKNLFSPCATNSRSARGRMILSSIVILLSAAVVLFGFVGILCLIVLKCGFINNFGF